MQEELDINEILAAMRQQIGAMAHENAILTAKIKQLQNGPSNTNLPDTSND